MIYKISAQDDVVYVEAESEREAVERLMALFGPMPEELLTITVVTEVPEGESVV